MIHIVEKNPRNPKIQEMLVSQTYILVWKRE